MYFEAYLNIFDGEIISLFRIKIHQNISKMKMKIVSAILLLCFSSLCINVCAQENKTKLPPEATEVWEPEPRAVSPGKTNSDPPSDAIVLFGGNSLSAWESEKNGGFPQWEVSDGKFTVVKGTGSIKTKQAFGDMQLHVEWQSPPDNGKTGQGKGNSGIFLMGIYEVQVLDSYKNRTYSNGQATSIYKQHSPLVNATKPTGEWQTYDIIFTAPHFNKDGMLVKPAYVTVLHNGILVQNHVELKGPTEYTGIPSYKAHSAKLPIYLQDHGDAVSFRNIWVREL